MSTTMQVTESIRVNGVEYSGVRNLTSEGAVSKSVTVSAAKSGSLTTRTSDSQGELTMDSGHGIETGDRLDLYWTGGSRRGITVGTVSGDAVPLSTGTGSGDVLPAQDTEITAMVPVEEEFLLTGNNAEALLLYSEKAGTIVLAESDDSEATAEVLSAAVVHLWEPNRDATIPVAGAAVTKIFFSHGDSSNTSDMSVVALFA